MLICAFQSCIATYFKYFKLLLISNKQRAAEADGYLFIQKNGPDQILTWWWKQIKI